MKNSVEKYSLQFESFHDAEALSAIQFMAWCLPYPLKYGVDILRRRDNFIRLSMLSNILQFCDLYFDFISYSILLNLKFLVV